MLATDLVNPGVLTGFIRELQFPDVGLLERFLPNQELLAIEYEFVRTDAVRRKAAQYRPFDVPSPIGARPGLAKVRGSVPPISKKMVLGEEEQLLVDALKRQQILTPEMEATIYNDAQNLTGDIQARVEYARSQVLTTGKVTFTNDLGFVAGEIDYGIPNTNFVTTTSGGPWSNPTTGKPISDMMAWRLIYRAANGNRNPAVGLINSNTLANLTLSDEVKAFIVIAGVVGSTLAVITEAQVAAVIGSKNLPPLVVIDEVIDVEGIGEVKVIPDDKLVYLPAPSTDRFGYTHLGPTVESINLARGGFLSVATAPGLTATNMRTFDPEHIWTKVAGLVVPVLKDPNAVMVADLT